MFRLLEIGDPEWVGRVVALGFDRRDLHQDQRMLAPYVAADKNKAFLALTTSDDGFILEPLLRTPEGDLKHATNFGGPMASSDMLNLTEHMESIDQWAVKTGAKSKYCTLIPSLAESQIKLFNSAGITLELKKQSVIVDLNDRKIRGTTRRLAIKSKEAGVEVKSYPTETHLGHFINIYQATMARVDAKEHWKFSPKWFEVFARFVKPCLLLAEYENKFQAGCLIVYSQQYPVAYYHFAGNYNNYSTLGISQQLILAACEFIKLQGIQFLYLGGGITDSPDDSLLLFKSGFSRQRLPVYIHKTMYNTNATVL